MQKMSVVWFTNQIITRNQVDELHIFVLKYNNTNSYPSESELKQKSLFKSLLTQGAKNKQKPIQKKAVELEN